jgi:hypothetical protein
METKLKLTEDDNKFIDLLFDRYQNPLFDRDTAFFEIIDKEKETLYTYNINKEDVRTNFSRDFLDSFKEAVTKSKEVLGYDSIDDNKLSIGPYSIMEFVSGYYAHKKVVDMIDNTNEYRKYLKDNKDLYIIEDWKNYHLINTLNYLPELKESVGSSPIDNFFSYIKNKPYNCYLPNSKVIHPFRRTYGDNLVIFKDFLEEIKSDMKNHHPDAVKVIIRKGGIKRFFGITNLNDKPVYYNNSEAFMNSNESQFEDRTVEWFFIKKDGTIIDFWQR